MPRKIVSQKATSRNKTTKATSSKTAKKTAVKAPRQSATKKSTAAKAKNAKRAAVAKKPKKTTNPQLRKVTSGKGNTRRAKDTSESMPAAAKKKAVGKAKTTTSKGRAKVRSHKETKGTASEFLLMARKRKVTPAFFKMRQRKNTPIVFTLEDVKEIIKTRKELGSETTATKAKHAKAGSASSKTSTSQPTQAEKRTLGAASVLDILGFNPQQQKPKSLGDFDATKVPKKWAACYKALIELRDHVKSELDLHTKDTLRKPTTEDAERMGYGQRESNNEEESFDREFALSLLSSEQEALYEIEEAIQRIMNNTYGICEITQKPINKERLLAVPFTRYSIEGQKEHEQKQRRSQHRGGASGVFLEASGDEISQYAEDTGE